MGAVRNARESWKMFAEAHPELAAKIEHLGKEIAIDLGQEAVTLLIKEIPGIDSNAATQAIGNMADKLLVDYLESLRESRPNGEITETDLQNGKQVVQQALSKEMQKLRQGKNSNGANVANDNFALAA